MPVEPDQEQIRAVMERTGPRVMLNLNRYRDRDAYLRYAAVAERVLERIGGRVLWHTRADMTVIGDDSDAYDEVIAVWYPSIDAFVALATDPEILEARADRVAGLERAALIACDAGPEPELGVLGA